MSNDSFTTLMDSRVRDAWAHLSASGAEVWLVGGAVRDLLRHQTPKDYDFAWSGKAHEFTQHITEGSVIPTGLTHGTVTWVYRDLPIEVTTFRTDGPYLDHRRPESVQFVQSIEEDLARRDLTINAMAWNPKQGLLDPFHGQTDMKHRIIRTVGDPNRRFTEDALRILRTLRFAATLDGNIEPVTAHALTEHTPDLKYVAKERIITELLKLLTGTAAARIMSDYPIPFTMIAPLAPATRFKYLPPDLTLRLTAYLYGQGWDDTDLKAFFDHWPLPKRLAKDVQALLKAVDLIPEGDESPRHFWLRCIRIVGRSLAPYLVDWHKADQQVVSPFAPKIPAPPEALFALDGTLKSDVPDTPNALDITGHDLIALGVPPGPAIGALQERLWIDYTDEQVANRRDALIAHARHIIYLQLTSSESDPSSHEPRV